MGAVVEKANSVHIRKPSWMGDGIERSSGKKERVHTPLLLKGGLWTRVNAHPRLNLEK